MLLLLVIPVANLVLLLFLLKMPRSAEHHDEPYGNDVWSQPQDALRTYVIRHHPDAATDTDYVQRRQHFATNAKSEADEEGWIVVQPNERYKQGRVSQSTSRRPYLDEIFDNPYVLSTDIHASPVPAGPRPVNFVPAQQKPTRRLVVWSQDFRVGPAAALKHVLAPLGVVFVDQSLSPLCNVTRTCARDLDAISQLKMWHLSDKFAHEFHAAYANDVRFSDVDAFICVYPPSQCELFAAFNKSVILVIDDRYELGREAPSRWTDWNMRLVRIASDQKNAVVVTNEYDRQYVQHFTQMYPPRIPYHCGYVDVFYKPLRPTFLLMPSAQSFFDNILLRDIATTAESSMLNVALERVSVRYGRRFRLVDLTRHRGLVYVPHQPSYLAFTERYRAGIPMFVPDVHLLTSWHLRHMVVAGKTHAASQRTSRDGSVIKGAESLPDPNDDTRKDTIAYWLHHSDFYRWPHVIQFTSIEDLVRRLATITSEELRTISRGMFAHSAKEQRTSTMKWTDIINRIVKYKNERSSTR